MGTIERVAEESRQQLTGDDWYTKELPYAFELRMGDATFVFVLPLGPEAYEVRPVYRATTTPTFGGVVSEEQGLLWRDITIRGSFALSPRDGYDTSGAAVLAGLRVEAFRPGSSTRLSGPAWTRRLIRNIFEHYAAAKADPLLGPVTALIWHDFKFDDHWVVVPEGGPVISRSLSARLQYPYSISLRAIDDATAIKPPKSRASLVDHFNSGITRVREGVTLLSSALQLVTSLSAETSYAVAGVESVLFDAYATLDAATAYIEQRESLILVGLSFVTDTARALEAQVVLMETTAEFPRGVRAAYMQAVDALDSIAAQRQAFAQDYADVAEQQVLLETPLRLRATAAQLQAAADAGAPQRGTDLDRGGLTAVDQQLAEELRLTGRSFARYTSTAPYRVRAGDTLQSIASAQLGDGALWYDIALLNGLVAPYITEAGAPGTVRPGATLTIPTTGSPLPSAQAARGRGSEPGEDLYGTDWLREVVTPAPRPGEARQPIYDRVIDPRTGRDLLTVGGERNLVQAVRARAETPRGALPLVPSYGVRHRIGTGNNAANVTALQVSMRESLLADSRVGNLGPIVVNAEGDRVEVAVQVIPRGVDSAVAVVAVL